MKKILALVLAMTLLIPAFALAESDGSVQKILDKGEFILGLDDSFPPMGFRDEKNEIVGFDIDLAREVCARLGVELKLQPIDWAAKELELSSGNIDCIWNGMSITPERQESMSMSFSYMNNKIELYVNADSGIASLADMAGKKLGVQSGSFAEEVLTDYEQYDEFEKSLGEVLGFDEYLTALMDLQAGNIDGVLMDLVVGEYRLAGMDGNNIVAAVSLEDDNYGIGFRKEDVELRDKVEEILREMAADGKVAEIASNWFGSDISTIQ